MCFILTLTQIRRSSSPFHRNQITRLSGCWVPREQLTALRGSLHSWAFSSQWLLVLISILKITSTKLWPFCVLFPFSPSPWNIAAFSTTSASLHQSSSLKSLNDSGAHYYGTLSSLELVSRPVAILHITNSHRSNWCQDYEELKEKRLRVFTVAQYQCECYHDAALKSECNIPVPSYAIRHLSSNNR